MAEDTGLDVIMQIVVTAGSLAMEAESLTEFEPLTPGDPMVKDFKPGHFCELTEFDFSAGAETSLSKKAEKGKTAPTTKAVSGARVGLVLAQFERVARRERGDFVDMREVSYTRVLDSASPLLFKALTECTTLASISIVKRKGAGAAASGLGYLRLDFEDVLMTELSWNDSEHVMMESGTFIYRKLKINYLSQKADGSLVAGSSATWKMKTTRTGG